MLAQIKKAEKANKVPCDVFDVYRLSAAEEKMTMKLKLLFIVMDLLTILAYPIVFLHGKLRQLSIVKESVPLNELLVTADE